MATNDSFPEELLPEGEDETYEETDLEESDLDEEEIKHVQSCENMHLVFDAADRKKDFMIHSVSSIMHVVACDGKFLCGRAIGTKHIEIPGGVQINTLPFCQQCENSRLDRLQIHEESSTRRTRSLVE